MRQPPQPTSPVLYPTGVYLLRECRIPYPPYHPSGLAAIAVPASQNIIRHRVWRRWLDSATQVELVHRPKNRYTQRECFVLQPTCGDMSRTAEKRSCCCGCAVQHPTLRWLTTCSSCGHDSLHVRSAPDDDMAQLPRVSVRQHWARMLLVSVHRLNRGGIVR